MKINWKLRLKNKTILVSLLLCIVTFIYQVLGILGITPTISEDTITQLIGLLANILVAVGVVVDPTTKGVSDSAKAVQYNEPR